MSANWPPSVFNAPQPASHACPYCAGEGWRVEYVGSRFLGSEPVAHPTTVKCWSCNGSGRAVLRRPTPEGDAE